MGRRPRRRTGVTPAVVIVFLVVAALAYLTLGPPANPPSDLPPTGEVLTVAVLDVGQGDSILVRSPTGQTMVIDAGTGASDANERIVPRLRQWGVNRITYVVLTHPDQDHVGGMPALLQAMPAENVAFSGQVSTNLAYRDFLELVRDKAISAIKARRGVTLDLGPDVTAEVLNPPSDLFEDDNNNSVVIKLTFGQVSFLLQGDAETEAIGSMIGAGLNLSATVLKVGHHGSSNGTNEALLQAVNPRYALISVGLDNPYGHPHRETLGLLGRWKVAVYRTDQQGMITVTTDGRDLTVRPARERGG